MTMIATTQPEITRIQVVMLASACKLYAKTGMVPNRQWTAKKLRETASSITGNTYKARREEFMKAHDDLRSILDNQPE